MRRTSAYFPGKNKNARRWCKRIQSRKFGAKRFDLEFTSSLTIDAISRNNFSQTDGETVQKLPDTISIKH